MAPDAAIPWTRVSTAVERLLGLHFPPERQADLERGLRAAAREHGHGDAGDFARGLLAAVPDAGAVEMLAAHLAIGETYFFRGDETFAALAKTILPDLIATRRSSGQLRLRIWSAACCSGEEAYSLAILLRQLLPDLAEWQVDLLGTDINPRFLRKAASGEYTTWSFRGTRPEFRARHFRRAPGGHFALLPDIREMVRFLPMNLVEGPWPPALAGGAFDLILCRNVLMYFSPEQAVQVAARLHRALGPDGWLAVAPCEASAALVARFRASHCEGTVFYRHKRRAPLRSVHAPASAGPTAAPGRLKVQRAQVPKAPPYTLSRPRTTVARPMGRTRSIDTSAAPPATVLAARARELADQRRVIEALECCDNWIAGDKLDADAHCLRGMILAEAGRGEEARAALQRSLYLDPHRIMPSLALADLHRARGEPAAAARHYRHALALLRKLPPEAEVPGSEGVPARQLVALVTQLLAVGGAA